MELHPDDFATKYRAAQAAAAALVKAFEPFSVEPCMDDLCTAARVIVDDLQFMVPQIDEMLARREEDMRRGRIAYDREMAAERSNERAA